SALGVPLGVLLAEINSGPLQQAIGDIFFPMEAVRPPLTLETILWATVAGVVTALLAALAPAVQAASEAPADAVRRVPLLAGWRMRAFQAGGSTLLILAGTGLFALRRMLPDRVGTFGSLGLILVGGLLAAPLLSAAIIRLLRPLARQVFGIEGRLAAGNLARSPGRTGLVIAALAAGTALLIQT